MTTDPIKALVERLRKCRCVEATNIEDVTAYVRENFTIRHEAAAAIEALTPIASGSVVVPLPRHLVAYHFERLAKHVKHCIDNFYGTEHTPQFNWAEWKDVLVALKAAEKMASEGRASMIAASPSASTGKDGVVERVARAICQENCAFVGEKPCFEVEGAWPNPNCQEPGCHSQARAALAAINGEK